MVVEIIVRGIVVVTVWTSVVVMVVGTLEIVVTVTDAVVVVKMLVVWYTVVVM